MRKISKPTYDIGDVYDLCISRVKNPDLKQRLERCKSDIINASLDYNDKATRTMLHQISIMTSVRDVSAKEMEKVYTYRMAKKKTSGRPIYDKLKSSSKYGRCPLCGQRVVSSLDHHLPKTDFPLFVVNPINLIPSCGDCNKVKDTYKASSQQEETLHPYYDDVENDKWLKARVINTTPCSIEFFVDKPSSWSDLLFERTLNHFKLFGLANLYSSESAQELVNINYRVASLHSLGGYQFVKDHLQEEAVSRNNAYLNSWQTAFYEALSSSSWYCDGGFRL